MGDQALLDAALEHADRTGGVWDGGNYYFRRNDDIGVREYTPRWAGASLTMARFNVKHGLWRLYNDPWE